MPRPLDPQIDDAIHTATLALLSERGFAGMSVEAIAVAAGVGKPAIYRRYPDKAALVAAVIAARLPVLEVPDLDDTRAELWQAVERGFPADGAAYVGLIGGLIAEQERHPELIDAFRRFVLLPRRAVGIALVERGQRRGDIRDDIAPVAAIDLFAGPFLARVFAGLDTGAQWRESAFTTWWTLLQTTNGTP
jgi:AcrR family transcriptional regulator